MSTRELMFKTDVASKLLAENVTFFPYDYGSKAVKVTTAERLKSVIKSVDQVNDYANPEHFWPHPIDQPPLVLGSDVSIAVTK